MNSRYLKQIADYNFRQATPIPEQSALLLLDLQHYFADLVEPIEYRVRRLVAACRSSGIPVLFTQHGHHEDRDDRGMLANWWDYLIEYGSQDWELLFEPETGEQVFYKTRYSAFQGTKLHQYLRQEDIKDLIIAGVLTNCCCETTARDAFMHDYRVFFLCDGTATVNEDLHLASLKTIAYGFAHVMSTDAVCSFLENDL